MLQSSIIRLASEPLNPFFQRLILTMQNLIILLSLVECFYLLNQQHPHPSNFRFLTQISIQNLFGVAPTLFQLFAVLSANLALWITIIISLKYRVAIRFTAHCWAAYPNLIHWIVLQVSIHNLLQQQIGRALLASFNIFSSLLTTLVVSTYSLELHPSQHLVRISREKYFIPLVQSILAILHGTIQQIPQLALVYLGALLCFDLINGPYCWFTLRYEYSNQQLHFMIKKYSAVRIPSVILILLYRHPQLVHHLIFLIPFVLHLTSLLDSLFLSRFLYRTNGYYQAICTLSYPLQLKDNEVESYITFYKQIVDYPDPRNRILMLSIFCTHMSQCKNLDCFCQNQRFTDNVHVTTQLTIDIKAITQQINYLVGAKEITLCYRKLLATFMENYMKITRSSDAFERLHVHLSQLEIEHFNERLFKTKLRFTRLSQKLYDLDPRMILRQGVAKIVNQTICGYLKYDSNTIDIHFLVDQLINSENVQQDLHKLVLKKLEILDLLTINYQQPVPYLLLEQSSQFVVSSNELERQLVRTIHRFPNSLEIRSQILSFYSYVKIDPFRRYQYQTVKNESALVSSAQSAYLVAPYEKGLIIEHYSLNFQKFAQQNSSLLGQEVEILIPGFMQNFHRDLIRTLVKTGQTRSLRREFDVFYLRTPQFIEQVEIILRIDQQSLFSLKFIAFIRQIDQQDPLIISSLDGLVQSYSERAYKKLKLFKCKFQLNVNWLSPDISSTQPSPFFEGFILIPKVAISFQSMVEYYKYYLNKPAHCIVAFVCAQQFIRDYQKLSIHCLRLQTVYPLKSSDFKYVALEILLKQAMMKSKVRTQKIHTSLDSFRQIDLFKKIKLHQTSLSQSENLSDSIAPSLPKLTQQPIPELLSSLQNIESNRNLINSKCEHNFDSGENQHASYVPLVNGIKLTLADDQSDSKESTSKRIELVIEVTDDLNIYDQIAIVQQEMKQRFPKQGSSKQSLNRKKRNQKQKTISSINSESKYSNYTMIQSSVRKINQSEFKQSKVLTINSIAIVLTSLSFVIAYVLQTKSELADLRRDIKNTSYPLNQLINLNTILIGSTVNFIDAKKYSSVSNRFVAIAKSNYIDSLLQADDGQRDYHKYQQDMDRREVQVQEGGVSVQYTQKYLLKQVMMHHLNEVESNIERSLFFYENYSPIMQTLVLLANETLEEVINMVAEIQNFQSTILVLSVISNLAVLSFLWFLVINSVSKLNLFSRPYFLFSNLNALTNILKEMIRGSQRKDQTGIEKLQKEMDYRRNKRAKVKFYLQLVLALLLLLCLSLGFYLPLTIYLEQQQNRTYEMSRLQVKVMELQAGVSVKITQMVLNLYDPLILRDAHVVQEMIEKGDIAEQFVLFQVPFDSRYSEAGIFQKFSHQPICQCSIINESLMKGYNGFVQYLNRFLASRQQDTRGDQLLELLTAYLTVVEYQISFQNDLFNYVHDQGSAIDYSIELISILSQIFIVILQVLLLKYIRTQLYNREHITKYLLYLFTPQLLSTNKYLLQKINLEAKL